MIEGIASIVFTAVASSTQMLTPQGTSLRFNNPVPLLGGQGLGVQDCPNYNQRSTLITQKWFERSQMYQELAQESVERGHYDFSCYAAQQAVEFFLEGLLIAKTGAKPYSHSLTMLVEALANTGIEIPVHVTDCARVLGEHYLQARCPDARLDDYSKSEALEAVRCMEVMIHFLREIHSGTS